MTFPCVSSYWYCDYSICDSCMYCCIDYNDSFHLHGVSQSSRSEWCGSAATARDFHSDVCYHSDTCQLCHGFSTDEFFSFKSLVFHRYFMLVLVMVFAVHFQPLMWLTFPPKGLNQWNLHTTTLQSIPVAGICGCWCWFMACVRGASSSFSHECFEKGVPNATQAAVIQSFNQYGRHTVLGTQYRVMRFF